MYVYPKTPYLKSDKTLVSFPYFLEAIGGPGAKRVSPNRLTLFGHSIEFNSSAKQVRVDGRVVVHPADIDVDSTTKVPFVALEPILDAIKIPYRKERGRPILHLKDDRLFQQVASLGAGTPFDLTTQENPDVYPLGFSLAPAAVKGSPDVRLRPYAQMEGAPVPYSMSLAGPGVERGQLGNVARLITHFDDPVGWFQQQPLPSAKTGPKTYGKLTCNFYTNQANCSSNVTLFYVDRAKTKPNPIFYILFKSVRM